VVIGIVETHGRKGIIELAQQLEAVPRVKLEYKGTIFEEMDVDAIIARHPQVVLVDELAHTNIPGSKHRKRYEDVQEILAAKIDVLSTLNIQHMESIAPDGSARLPASPSARPCPTGSR
jgi:two-component system sensor histidine kinase KdpD